MKALGRLIYYISCPSPLYLLFCYHTITYFRLLSPSLELLLWAFVWSGCKLFFSFYQCILSTISRIIFQKSMSSYAIPPLFKVFSATPTSGTPILGLRTPYEKFLTHLLTTVVSQIFVILVL